MPFRLCEVVDREIVDGELPRSGCERSGAVALMPSEAAKVRRAVAEWNARLGTHLRFLEVASLGPGERGVLFEASLDPAGCSTSQVGRPRRATRTRVLIGSWCNGSASFGTPVYTIVHEMMHVAGFYHEQQRPDRDTMLTVRGRTGSGGALLDGGKRRQWRKLGGRSPARLLSAYDFMSVMHYPVKNVSNVSVTPVGFNRIIAQGASLAEPGTRDGFSIDDLAALKMLYPAQTMTIR